MTPLMIAFFLECLCWGEMAQTSDPKSLMNGHQRIGFISANVGEEVTLNCSYEGDIVTKYYWYKQTLGQKPELLSTSYKYDTKGIFHGEFENNPRFTLDNKVGHNHLRITDVHITDTATYYCAFGLSSMFEFMEGTTLRVKGSGLNFQLLINQSASETTKPGDDVTLNCTVHTGTCDGEHSVYWFKDSEESHPGLIYTHGDGRNPCPSTPNQQTCEYNLPMKSVDHSHAGTYYCAVASCGRILFGNGTKLDLEDSADSSVFWKGAVTLTTMLSALLAFTVCMMNKRNSSQSPESEKSFSASSTATAEGYQEKHHLYYAAVNLTNSSRGQRDPTWSECVYYGLRS